MKRSISPGVQLSAAFAAGIIVATALLALATWILPHFLHARGHN